MVSAPTNAQVVGQMVSATKAAINLLGAPLGGPLASLTAPAATAATNSSPYGYAQTQADALVTAVIAIVTILKKAGLATP